jgi:2-dehydro-3-deoxygluconokinase
LKPGKIDWDEVLQDVVWFNFSAISPALNDDVAQVCLEAVKAASEKNITVSVDLNYREKLWQYGKEPNEVMPGLVQHCDVVMGNIWAEEKMLGIPINASLADTKEAYLEQSMKTSEAIFAKFPKCRQVAHTFRFNAGEGVRYYATLYDGRRMFVASERHAGSVIDKVGSGDTFMAGLIFSNYHQQAPQDTIEFAAAAAFNKLFIKGDATTSTVEEIMKGSMTYA